MMKAVLVVDLPNNVNMDRVIQTPVTLSFDLGGIKQLMFADGYLKPLPQKIYAEFPNSYEYGLADGYNRCVDEVMGETE